jgi:hypothetical protein
LKGARSFMRVNSAFWPVLLAAVLLGLPATAAANSCESLTALGLPGTMITLAQSVAAGTFTPPKAPGLVINGGVAVSQLPPEPPMGGYIRLHWCKKKEQG